MRKRRQSREGVLGWAIEQVRPVMDRLGVAGTTDHAILKKIARMTKNSRVIPLWGMLIWRIS
jgi:hypothetical protein